MINKITDGVLETDSLLTVKNKHFSFTVSKKNGRVCEIINLYNQENIISDNGEFINLIGFDEKKIPPVSLTKNGEVITAEFENGMSVDFRIEVFDTFITVEILSEPDNRER